MRSYKNWDVVKCDDGFCIIINEILSTKDDEEFEKMKRHLMLTVGAGVVAERKVPE